MLNYLLSLHGYLIIFLFKLIAMASGPLITCYQYSFTTCSYGAGTTGVGRCEPDGRTSWYGSHPAWRQSFRSPGGTRDS